MNNEFQDQSRDDIWDDANVLPAASTKNAKVHVTIRLDPQLYKQIVRYRDDHGAKTTTSAIEALLQRSIGQSDIEASKQKVFEQMAVALRNVMAHAKQQDAVIALFTSKLSIRKDSSSEVFDMWKRESELLDRERRVLEGTLFAEAFHDCPNCSESIMRAR